MQLVGFDLQNIADKRKDQPGRLSVEISTPNFFISPESMCGTARRD
jgi:hypothetical protein